MTSMRQYTTDSANNTVTVIHKEQRAMGGERIEYKIHHVDGIFSATDTDTAVFEATVKPFLEGMISGTTADKHAAVVLTGQSGMCTSIVSILLVYTVEAYDSNA
jgi:hypothetical protein